MKFLITILLLVLPLNCFAIEQDKLFHFNYSVILGSAGYSISDSILVGTAIGTLPGLGKELYDASKDDNKFSKEDFAYDIAGAFVGAVISKYLTEYVFGG